MHVMIVAIIIATKPLPADGLVAALLNHRA